MNRRDFLKYLGLGGVALATPKFIFDVGANLYKQRPPNLLEGTFAIWENVVIHDSETGLIEAPPLSWMLSDAAADMLIGTESEYFVRLTEPSEFALLKLELDRQ